MVLVEMVYMPCKSSNGFSVTTLITEQYGYKIDLNKGDRKSVV